MTDLNLLSLVREALEDIKAQDIVELDISEKSSIADWMVVVSGTSSRHLQAIVDNVELKAKNAGFMPSGREGEPGSEWVLIDFGDLILHVMLPQARAYYDLERLWQGPGPLEKKAES